MEHDDYKMMLPLHALAGLDGDEENALARHLAACKECRSELYSWQGTAGALAYAVDPLEPSPQVRSRILESVRAETRNNRTDKVIPIARPASTNPRAIFWPPLAIAALVMLGLIVGLVVLWRQNQEARTAIARSSQQLQETSAQLEEKRDVIQLLSMPSTRMAELAGTKEAPGAHAMVAVDPKSRRAVFMAQGLPQAPAGKAYQLWFISGSKPMPGPVFKSDSAGNAMMMDKQVPSEALTAGAFAVTLEPQEGVSSPTGPMYLLSPAKPVS